MFSNELPLSKCTITFCGTGKHEWNLLAFCLGAEITSSLTFYNSHIVMLNFERSQKKLIGKKYNVHICGTQWLIDSLLKKRCQPNTVKMYDQEIYPISVFKGISFYFADKYDSILYDLIKYAQGALLDDPDASDFTICENPEISLRNAKWLKMCIINNRILDLPGTEYCLDDGEFLEMPLPKVFKKSDHIDIIPRDLTDDYKGRDVDEFINSQSLIIDSNKAPIQSTINDQDFSQLTPMQNSLMTPKNTGLFDRFAFVFCGLQVTSRRTYRSHLLKNGAHCFSIQELQPWSNNRENQESNMRLLLKFLRELNFSWILVWSSDLPYLLSSKKFLLKSNGANNMVHVVNETWLTDALSLQILGDLEQFEYKPFRHLLPLVEFDKIVICVTGYDNKYRLTIKNLIKILGGNFSDAFTDKVQYLIAPKPYDPKNAKIVASGKYNIPVVTKEWLHQCLNVGKKIEIGPFQVEMILNKVNNENAMEQDIKPLNGVLLYVVDDKYKQIVVQLGSTLTNEKDAKYVIMEPHQNNKNSYGRDEYVDPKWLMTCQKLQKLVPVDHFIWKKKKILIEPIVPHKRKSEELKEKRVDVSYE